MAIRDRGTNYFVDYEDNGFGGDMFGGYGGGIASLPAAPVPAPAPAPAPQAAAEEVDEPKKRESKKAETPAPTAKKNLDSVVAAWTDEE